jgi:hypothetical protein
LVRESKRILLQNQNPSPKSIINLLIKLDCIYKSSTNKKSISEVLKLDRKIILPINNPPIGHINHGHCYFPN